MLQPIDTQKYIIWGEAVTVVSVRRTGNATQPVGNAGVYKSGVQELVPSFGVVPANRIRVTVATDSLPWSPKPRDRVQWKGDYYTVQRVDGTDWLKFWILEALNLTLAFDLVQTGSLLRPANNATAEGKRVPNPVELIGGISCRVQPQGGRVSPGTFDAQTQQQTYRAWLDRDVFPQADDIFMVDAVRYEVVGWGDVELIGAVPYLDLRVIP